MNIRRWEMNSIINMKFKISNKIIWEESNWSNFVWSNKNKIKSILGKKLNIKWNMSLRHVLKDHTLNIAMKIDIILLLIPFSITLTIPIFYKNINKKFIMSNDCYLIFIELNDIIIYLMLHLVLPFLK